MQCGSSPRLRGTLSFFLPFPIRLRFIPAPAGNTFLGALSRGNFPVHPRACGEHCFRRYQISPKRRFIPAPAGNTQTYLRRLSCCAVHPRACGEHDSDPGRERFENGSSPRLRGTLSLSWLDLRLFRFIPAPAGNTLPLSIKMDCEAVHPRACGEHVTMRHSWIEEGGSSPRLRGTQTHGLVSLRRDRFIPAPAGNTLQLYNI